MVPDFRKIIFGENKFSHWIIIIRKGHKMLAVLLARRWCKSPEIFVYSKECRKNAWSRWGSGLLTLDEYASSIIFYVQLKVYKLLWKIKLWALLTEAWSPHVILPSSFFSAWLPGAQGPSEFSFLPGLLRLTREGAQCGSPSAVREGACGLHEQCKSLAVALLAFSVNQGIQSLSLLYFLNCKIISLSLYLSLLVADAVTLWITLDPAWAGPR